jgi:5'-deoxynucleotidase YfbR-like HD superfamily hydrolase
MKNLIDFLTNGADVKRFHTVNTINTETVGHHSHGVAVMCFLFDYEPSKELLTAALFHDLAEQFTGDIPSPAKRELGIGKDVSDLETDILRRSGVFMPELPDEDTRTLKLADISHGLLFCLKEIRMGNHKMGIVFNRYVSYAENMALSEKEKRVFDNIISMAREELSDWIEIARMGE